MAATRLDITIEQGATFSQTIAVGEAYDGYTARASIRTAFGGSRVVDLSCTTVASGNTTISLTAAQAALLTAPAYARADEREVKIGEWDLELVSGETVVRSRYGEANLSREATT